MTTGCSSLPMTIYGQNNDHQTNTPRQWPYIDKYFPLWIHAYSSPLLSLLFYDNINVLFSSQLASYLICKYIRCWAMCLWSVGTCSLFQLDWIHSIPALPPLPSLFRGYTWPLFGECILITCFTIVTCFIICVPVILGLNKLMNAISDLSYFIIWTVLPGLVLSNTHNITLPHRHIISSPEH